MLRGYVAELWINDAEAWVNFSISIADGRRKPEDEDMRVAAHAIA